MSIGDTIQALPQPDLDDNPPGGDDSFDSSALPPPSQYPSLADGYIDSSGIAALVEGFQNAREKGSKFGLVAASKAVMAVLQLARLDRVFPMFPTLEAARAA